MSIHLNPSVLVLFRQNVRNMWYVTRPFNHAATNNKCAVAIAVADPEICLRWSR